MVSFLKRLATAAVSFFIGQFRPGDARLPTHDMWPTIFKDRSIARSPFGTSKRTVAQDRRAAAKSRAKSRAKKLGQA